MRQRGQHQGVVRDWIGGAAFTGCFFETLDLPQTFFPGMIYPRLMPQSHRVEFRSRSFSFGRRRRFPESRIGGDSSDGRIASCGVLHLMLSKHTPTTIEISISLPTTNRRRWTYLTSGATFVSSDSRTVKLPGSRRKLFESPKRRRRNNGRAMAEFGVGTSDQAT